MITLQHVHNENHDEVSKNNKVHNSLKKKKNYQFPTPHILVPKHLITNNPDYLCLLKPKL